MYRIFLSINHKNEAPCVFFNTCLLNKFHTFFLVNKILLPYTLYTQSSRLIFSLLKSLTCFSIQFSNSRFLELFSLPLLPIPLIPVLLESMIQIRLLLLLLLLSHHSFHFGHPPYLSVNKTMSFYNVMKYFLFLT